MQQMQLANMGKDDLVLESQIKDHCQWGMKTYARSLRLPGPVGCLHRICNTPYQFAWQIHIESSLKHALLIPMQLGAMAGNTHPGSLVDTLFQA